MAAVRNEKGQFVSTKVRVEPRFDRVARAEKKAAFENLRHAAFSIGRLAKSLIKKRPGPSRPGTPPSTRAKGGKNLKGAIFTAASSESALIGPRASFIGESGATHEFGEEREGDDYPERPFMGPALRMSESRFASGWRGSIGE